ncbi:hypothetical protein FB471_2245 [Amycolatopsis cihanbeyliensis]|uniref:Uncharacterized protein n=1 Tax=Amycolatopsis cihanbeyliensis TaxID=1128664 RepID=A0A542DHJ0_AMYCI|nr:hypothetical protein FB471_2245 [Amycolatopsis cihanbeyliensis]
MSDTADYVNTVDIFNYDKTDRCIDDSLAYGLRSYPCNGSDWQKWDKYFAHGLLTFANVQTGRCLDDSNKYGLRAYSCNNSRYQKFFDDSGNVLNVVLRNEVTDRCVDDSFAYGLRSYSCNDSSYQKWHVWD